MGNNVKDSEFKYTKGEKEILTVLKDNNNRLNNLENSNETQDKDIANIRLRIEKLAKMKGIDLTKTLNKKRQVEPIKISKNEVLGWDEIYQTASENIDSDIVIEDLLTSEEINYCKEDVKRINKEFEEYTSLNKRDLVFLATATAIQTVRWVLIQKLYGDLGEKIDDTTRLNHDDDTIKSDIKSKNNKFADLNKKHGHQGSTKNYRSWEEILYGSAPYDATAGANSKYGISMEGQYHRYKTLGHDPYLGWIFGTANIITNTITLNNLMSFRVEKGLQFGIPTSLPEIFYETYDSVKEDWLRLPAAVFAQYVHLESDKYTKKGLPVPMLGSFSEQLAGDLYKSQYDYLCLCRDVKIVGTQATLSILTNMIAGLVHGLFYDSKVDGERSMYEARTRKILILSNVLASAGNIGYSISTEDYGKLDIGEILVTISRLFSDGRYLISLKKKFIEEQMFKSIEEELKDIDSHFI